MDLQPNINNLECPPYSNNGLHIWECESSSDYDDILRCTKCKKTYFQQSDKWGDEPPKEGCGGLK